MAKKKKSTNKKKAISTAKSTQKQKNKRGTPKKTKTIQPSSPIYTQRWFHISLEVVLILVLLLLTYWFTFFKVEKIQEDQYYSAHEQESEGFFWSETAFQYRYAKMIAEGADNLWQVLQEDKALQHPEGVNAFLDYALFMEFVHGYAYRWFAPKTLPFHIFLIHFVSWYTSLFILLLYGLLRVFFKKPVFAFLAAIVYPMITASYARMMSGVYLKEDFTLLVFILSVGLFILAMQRKSLAYGILTGVFLWITLVSWHLSQFYVFLLFFMFAVIRFLHWNTEWNHRNFLIISGFVLLAGVVPVLFVRGYFISLTMIILYTLLLAYYLPRWLKKESWQTRTMQLLIQGGLFIGLVALSFLIPNFSREYNHVFQLGWYKLIHFGMLPSDPTGLPFDVRVFWAGNFNTSSLEHLWIQLWMMLPLGVLILLAVPILALLKWIKLEPIQTFLYGLTLASFLLTLLIERLIVFYVPLLVLLLGSILVYAARYSQSHTAEKPRWLTTMPLVITMIVFLTCLGFNLARTITIAEYGDATSSRLEPEMYDSLFGWIRTQTHPDEAFLADLGDSPMILLYGQRPIVLNSQFENAFIRNRYHVFFETLYGGTESEFYNLAFYQWKATYFVYQKKYLLNTETHTPRWRYNNSQPIDPDSLIVKMHFFPHRLTHMTPLFDNDHYRVFRLLGPDEHKEDFRWDRGYSTYFDLDSAAFEGALEAGFVDMEERLKIFEETSDLAEQAQETYMDTSLDIQSRIRKAKGYLESALQKDPRDWTVYINMGIMMLETQQLDKALEYFLEAETRVPTDSQALYGTIDCLNRLRRFEEVTQRADRIVTYHGDNVDLLFLLAGAYYQLRDYRNAFETFTQIQRIHAVAAPLDWFVCALVEQSVGSVLTLLPNYQSVFPYIANIGLMVGNIKMARQALEFYKALPAVSEEEKQKVTNQLHQLPSEG
jgi:tetratricopeptide (TPR) repeat protein